VNSALLGLEVVAAVMEELGAGAIETEIDVTPRFVPGLLDGLQDDPERLFVGAQVGREASFITDGSGETLVSQDLLEVMKHLRAVAQRLAKTRRANRQDHEFLDVEAIVGVGAAIDDVHHRHRHHRLAPGGECLPEITIERQPGIARRGVGGCERDGENGIGPEASLVFGAVELDHLLIDARLVARVRAEHGGFEDRVDVLHGLEHALAEIALLVAVAQLHSLTRAGRGARGNRGPAHHAGVENDVGFDGGVTA
jgi:hypothetical protein